MRIREENCNLVLLAGVTLVSMVIAGGSAFLPAPAASKSRPVYATAAAPSPSPSANTAAPPTAPTPRPARLVDQTPVRVVGAPFVPNTNPRER
jgi:hypothetical protein